MKLDVNALRYLSKEEFRVLTAVEMGMRNHEIVPSELIERIAGLKRGGAYKNLRTLLRHKLVHHDSQSYDGFRLTNLGYDYLAIKTLANRGLVAGVGRQIGVGKESDIFEVVTEEGRTLVMKFHRLGRTSFRAVKNKRDYLRHRNAHSWLYLSRLAALKEYAFMKALGENGFPVPEAIDCNRHCVLMSLVDAFPMVQVRELLNPGKVFGEVLALIVRLAQLGLIHCDFNEFNLMVDDQENVTMIDFPQMVSVSHKNAEMFFERDVDCIYKFFQKRYNYSPGQEAPASLESNDGEGCEGGEESTAKDVPESEETEKDEAEGQRDGTEEEESGESDSEDEDLWQGDGIRPRFGEIAGKSGSLDRSLAASGFTKQSQSVLEKYIEEQLENLSEETELSDEDDDISVEYKAVQESTVSQEVEEQPESKAQGSEPAASGEGLSSFVMLPKADREAVDLLAETMSEVSVSVSIPVPDSAFETESVAGSTVGFAEEERQRRQLERVRVRAASAVKTGGSLRSSRNSAKDRSGRRSRHGGGKVDFDL